MILNFKNIIIKNFMSFGEAELTLGEEGYTLVSGKNTNPDDSAKSNGSGKSSIFDAISWCLTGVTIRGIKDVVNIHGNGGAYVELDFTVDGSKWKIIREKDPSNLRIFINDEDKSGKGIRDTEKILAEYLPDLTSELVSSVIILGQGLPQRFSSNTPSGRKDMLEKLSKSDFMIEDLKNRVSERKSELSKSKRAVEDEELKTKTIINGLESMLVSNQTKLDSLMGEEVYVENIAELNKKIETIDAEISFFTESISEEKGTLAKEKAKKDNLDSEIKAKTFELNSKFINENEPVKSEIVRLNTQIISSTKEINRLKSVVDICPTCGQKLPNVQKLDTTELEDSVKSMRASLAEATEFVNSKKIELENSIKLLNDEFSVEKNRLSSSIIELAKSIDLNEIAITTRKSDLRKITSEKERLEKELSELNVMRTSCENNISDCNNKLENLKNSVLYNINEQKENLKLHIEAVTKMETAIKRDFRGYLLQNVVSYIDKKVKEYCLDIFGTEKLNFRIDGNNISIAYDGKQYESLSGGEKVRVDIIIQLALRDMLCNFLNFSSNILVIDEIFDSLDSIGCERVTNLIFKELKDVNSIYIITHRADLPISCDREIVVQKNSDGISSIC